MPKKKAPTPTADKKDNLSGFDIKIDSFGHMQSNMSISDVNDFLNTHMEDKKLPLTKEEEQ